MSSDVATKDLTSTDEWIMYLQAVPERSSLDIARDREPIPVPFPLFSPFTGPPWWLLWYWLLWNFGDWLTIREKTNDSKQSGGRHRLVPRLPEAVVYRPGQGQDGGPTTPSPQERLPVPRGGHHVARRILA